MMDEDRHETTMFQHNTLNIVQTTKMNQIHMSWLIWVPAVDLLITAIGAV